MPITIKTNQISVKNPTTGVFESSEMFIPNINNLLDEKQDAPETAGTSGQVLGLDNNGNPEWVGQPNVPVTDVQVNGTSIAQNGVANVPKSDGTSLGVVKARYYGVRVNNDGELYVSPASIASEVKPGASNYLPIVPGNQHAAAFYGLAKAAGADMASSSNQVGIYTNDAKTAIKTMLGVTDDISQLNSALNDKYTKPASGIPAEDLASGVIPAVPVTDVQMVGTSILSNGVANIPLANSTGLGVIKLGDGFSTDNSTLITKVNFVNATDTQSGTSQKKALSPYQQHRSVFFGLAKAAGADMASLSSVTVGQYPEAQKVAIQKMLGIYQAPWELIREDEVTNATSADIDITVDGNGQPFQLTDVEILIWFEAQTPNPTIGDYGRVHFMKGDSIIRTAYLTPSGQVLTPTDKRIAGVQVLREKSHLIVNYFEYIANASHPSIKMTANTSDDVAGTPFGLTSNDYFDLVKIKAITGTANFRMFGKRKWT